jgi:hypothetical protein
MEINLYSPYALVSNEVVHPSVIKLKDRQFKYCLAYTPYPQSDNMSENPCLAYTNDFINFHYFGTQPIINAPSDGYNADPELLMIDNVLHLVYRHRSGLGNILKVYSLPDYGICEYQGELIKGEFKKQDYASPSLFNFNGMYYLFSSNLDSENWQLELRISPNLFDLKNAIPKLIIYDFAGEYIWHSTFKIIKEDIYGIIQFAKNTGGTGKISFVKFLANDYSLVTLATSTNNNYYRSYFFVNDDNEVHFVFSRHIDRWMLFYEKGLDGKKILIT